MPFFASARPLVFAHRGGMTLGPENTMETFDAGLKAGADGLELDVHLSADGVVVVHHDSTLERTTRGSGPLAARTAAELASLGVPALRDVLARHHGARIIIEMKVDAAAIGEAVAREVRDAGAVDRVCAAGFGDLAVRAARRALPEMATGASQSEVRRVLHRCWVRWPLRACAWGGYQVPERSGRLRVVSRRFIRYAHLAGLKVQVWTVDEEADMRRLLDWGVDALISNRPALAVRVRDEWISIPTPNSRLPRPRPETRDQKMQPPTLQDVYAARPRVYAALKPSPLLKHPLLDEALGLDVWVKHENHNPTCAFKVRGGLNLVAQLPDDERRRGVISASTGNHGQSIAFASKRHGIRCRIVVPSGNNPEKNASMRAMGAEVVEHGRDFDEARERVEQMVVDEGWRYIHSANEPHLLSGVGTYAVEIFEALPDADVILVPIGGGSGACGCCIARTGLNPKAQVIGVQAARADAFARSWRGTARVVGESADTFAEGMATRVTFDLTFELLEAQLDDIVTLDEDQLADGVRMALGLTHNLAEGAGGAALAAAKAMRDRLAGRTVVCVMSGGNIDAATLRRILQN